MEKVESGGGRGRRRGAAKFSALEVKVAGNTIRVVEERASGAEWKWKMVVEARRGRANERGGYCALCIPQVKVIVSSTPSSSSSSSREEYDLQPGLLG